MLWHRDNPPPLAGASDSARTDDQRRWTSCVAPSLTWVELMALTVLLAWSTEGDGNG
ncbi:MAG: hypothetical protein M3Q09_12115 [Gemmatimonadota bacterium]|nr:hypothetical protein [Gemmatimonadota bacterium]